ncbi:RCC1 domain-containing protein [Streptomyces sp. NPDC058665]|uniref:RCC1 domain-containing protein n=1 Tax=Streptomyces sp. NPDC058665 TaxID=3346586 RepID=UPI003647306F
MRPSRALLTAALTAGLALTPLAAVAAAPVQEDPSVLSWGAGRTGQLGNGATRDSSTPVPVTSLVRGDVEKISAGGTSSSDSFALALIDETVKSWGHNSSGQLGNGNRTNRSVPTAVSRLANVKDVAAGGEHALALDANGRVYAWGDNNYGQLGNSRTGDMRSVPSAIKGMPKVKQVSAGCDFSMALTEKGDVYAWGRGVYGQLGSGSRATSSVPRQIEGLENVSEIDAGCHHALALTADKTVKAWGKNTSGQLGDSSTRSSTTPVDVDWIEEVSDIEAGANHNYAITEDGRVWGWGNNQNNQLLEADPAAAKNNRQFTNRTTPIGIPRLEGAEQVAAGAQHGIAVFGEDIFAWGHNTEGQVGNSTTSNMTNMESVSTLDANSAPQHVAASLGGNTSYAY